MIVRNGKEVPQIREFLERTLKIKIADPVRVFGFTSDDGKRPLCAVAFNDYNGANIELTMVAQEMTRGVLRYLAHYVFVVCGCRRLTVRAKRGNKASQKTAQRLGFSYESVAKYYFHDDDAIVYRMLKKDCRWL